MCSVDPDEITEMTRATEELDLNSNTMCRRCKIEKAGVILREKDPYCKECFLSYFTHKFRSTIGKSKLIHPGDQILMATSGGKSSSAMLQLVREGLDESSHKKLRFEPACIYIDESCLCDDPETGIQNIQQVCKGILSQKFSCYVTSLEQIMSLEPLVPVSFTGDSTVDLHTNPVLKEQLKKLLSSCESDSAKQDLLDILRQDILSQCANALGYKKIFLADNATTLSVRIMSNMALGRGSQLANKVHFQAKHKEVEMYRPMRELLKNEIEYYNDVHNISFVKGPTLKCKASSITTCAEEFLMGLQSAFPATVPTVFRTGDKLVSMSTEISNCTTELNSDRLVNCALCGLHLDTAKMESSAFNATIVSQKLSNVVGKEGLTNAVNDSCETSSLINMLPSEKNCHEHIEKSSNHHSDSSTTIRTNSCDCVQQTSCCSSNKDKKLSDTTNLLPKNIMEEYLCYGCRIILREMGEVNHLPIKVRGSVAELERRKHMRAQIQDFLL